MLFRSARLEQLRSAPYVPSGSYPLVIDYALAKGLAHEAFGHAAESDSYRSSCLAEGGRLVVTGTTGGAETAIGARLDAELDDLAGLSGLAGLELRGGLRAEATLEGSRDARVVKVVLIPREVSVAAGPAVSGAVELESVGRGDIYEGSLRAKLRSQLGDVEAGSEFVWQSSKSVRLRAVALRAKVLEIDEATGGRILDFYPAPGRSFWDCLERLGQMPLPPYIQNSQAAAEQYQTVYSAQPGAVAAPTAGLHFTPELLERLKAMGIDQATVTLHVGVGTFRPVETERITEHQMHSEWVELRAETVEKIRATQAQGGRIIAVGTTVVRSLEGVMAQTGQLQPFQGKVNLFITPGFQWRVVSGLITNFHLPKSSLLMLVSALVGRQRLLDLYGQAILEGYRFYSFGDAMIILPEARSTGTIAEILKPNEGNP